MTLYIEPGGVPLETLEINGYALTPSGSGNVISPVFFAATIFFAPLAYGGGLSDLFCAKPVCDTGTASPVADTFIVPPGRTSC